MHAGFPNPATDTSLSSLDLNQLLITHAAATFFFSVQGNHWHDQGVFDGDIAIVDRALDPRSNDTVLWWDEHNNEFALSLLRTMPKHAQLWGVVTSTIHRLRKGKAA